ncbi:hypothetical protein [Streptomyces sp. RerS4]|uniref:hypothetical protein n=1 Tax=Streptomyces sp. RerS4 TaxID=2942449 RepID=UPI00201C238A|nr:hypothetical protein [Streptomyces sp. RerS4]UQX03546.1 hypothetical protein M4D82_25935 [Streptomyces sp. RerS4]
MYGSTMRGAALATLTFTLAAFTVACGGDDPKPSATAPSASASAPASPVASSAPSPTAPASRPASGAPAPTPSLASPAAGLPSPPPELVRDAFAGLQATLGDSCTPANCAYFLGRVHDELHRLDRAMKADPKGPGHFPEPIALIAKLDRELGGDRGFANLKKHQSALIATRDQINDWMQDHPDDYR